MISLAEVLERFGPAYLERGHQPSVTQARAWRAIRACRTEALGGQLERCADCGSERWRWHSCRNRHCPRCQKRAADVWRRARMAELLDVPYAHLVFTVPHELNSLATAHRRWVIETLFACVSRTLDEFARNPRWIGGAPAFTLVLHTWTQDLRLHIHAHALVACGALAENGSWIEPKRSEHFLFPVHALSKVFAGKFRAAMSKAQAAGQLPRDPASTAAERSTRLSKLRQTPWVVYAKAAMAGPAAVLDYLARYTHRTAIGHERLLGVRNDDVLVRVRGDHGGKRVIRIPGERFVGRFLQHVLPSGLKRIRHYGLLAPGHKRERLRQARTALEMPASNPVAEESAAQFMRRVARIEISRCPKCSGTLEVVACRVRVPVSSGNDVPPPMARGP
ncbi:MAG: IS91 family transposase [Burkholderiaceae bacterium]